MKSLWHLDPQTTALQLDLAAPEHAVHVESMYSLLSLGTELLVAKGQVPVELHKAMRVPYMDGDFAFPIKYGYSLVGRNTLTGEIGHVMHPHQTDCFIDADAFHILPDGVSPRRATLASNLETALTGVWDAGILPGERIGVFGFGMIGSLITRIASGIPGCHVTVFEPDETRRASAAAMGFHVHDDLAVPAEKFDVAFHCSATQEGLQQAIDSVGFEGRVIEMSWYGTAATTLYLGIDFHTQRKSIISSQVSNLPGAMQNRWSYRRRKEVVFELLKDPGYDAHITHTVTLEEAANLFNTWRNKRPAGLGYVIRY